VDDTLVCCGAKLDHFRYLRALFLCLEAISGLKINLAKSELVPVGNVENVEGWLAFWVVGFFSLLLGVSYEVKSIWDGVVEKIEQQLASWKKMCLSKGGRITLIK
jgi:hypothetical protein